MKADTVVTARLEESTKTQAAAIFEASGLTTSIVIRLFLKRVVEDGAMPFDIKKPNAKTLKAIRDAKSGAVKRAKSPQDLIKKMNAKR